MKVANLKLFMLVVLAQTALLGCEQDYSLKLSSKPQVPAAVEPLPGSSPAPSATPRGVDVVATPSPVISLLSALDSFQIPAVQSPKIDMLFVIDSSGSMDNEQNTLISSFSAFISEFTASNADYHIGIITTDSLSYYSIPITNTSNPYYGFQNPFPLVTSTAGSLITKYAGISYLTPSTPDVNAKFAANAKVGIKGSGEERCIYSALEALSVSKLANENAGFIRPDAMKSVFCVTDENEQIKNDAVNVNGSFVATETKPVQRIDRYLARMKELCPSGSACPGYRTDLVVDLNAAAPATATAYPLSSNVINSYPDFYLKLKAQAPTTTNTLNIRSSTWGTQLASVGSAIVQQAKQYRLAHKKVVLSSLRVSLVSSDGNKTALLANQYAYTADVATDASSFPVIDLPAATMQMASGKTLEISYQYSN